MKVLYISGMYPTPSYPQKGIFCHEQVKALKKIGVDVDVIVPMAVYDREYTKDIWEYEGVAIRYLRYFKLPGVRFFENIGKHLFKALKKSGIDFCSYDVIHADAPLPAGYAAMMLSEKYGLPFVVHAHGLDVYLDNSYKDEKNCDKISEACELVYKKANAVLGGSRKVLDNIQQRVDISGRDFVVYNGVDTDKFKPLENKPKSDVLRIVSVGNLIPLKGHDYTLRAIKQLVDEGYNRVSFKLAGRGPLEEELKALTNELGLEDKVEFLGYVPYDEVVKLLQNSDVFVMPSWYEALGCVYLEAMACGLPAVGCLGNGIDEIIKDGENGFLVPPKNTEQISEVLKTLFDNRLKEKIGECALESASNYYTWIDTARNLESIYGRLTAA